MAPRRTGTSRASSADPQAARDLQLYIENRELEREARAEPRGER